MTLRNILRLGRYSTTLIAVRNEAFVRPIVKFKDNTSRLQLQCLSYSQQSEPSQKPKDEKKSHEFQAETRMILDIVAKSLYSEKEVFVRELISNASDAVEKLKYICLSEGKSIPSTLESHLTTDKQNGILIIEDTGIGMTKEELISNIGTIARSGSKAFLEELKAKGATDASSIIGQFGVGFYSCFMVANKVEVFTKYYKEGSAGYKWSSDGSGMYDIEEVDNVQQGTKIVIHLKTDCREYEEELSLKNVILKYSNFIRQPVLVNETQGNQSQALWLTDPKEVSEKQHEELQDKQVLVVLQEFKNYRLTSLEKEMSQGKEAEAADFGGQVLDRDIDNLKKLFKTTLKHKIHSVKITKRLENHPGAITLDNMASARQFIKQMNALPEESLYSLLRPQLGIKPTCTGAVREYSTGNISEMRQGGLLRLIESEDYLDKSYFIKAILSSNFDEIMITAPRRFCKTTNLKMLELFLDCRDKDDMEKYSGTKKEYFKNLGLKIGEDKSFIDQHCGECVVLYLDLKDINCGPGSFTSFYSSFRDFISKAFMKHRYLLDSKTLLDWEKNDIKRYINREHNISEEICQQGLFFLTGYLHLHYKREIFLILDEFDAPIDSAIYNDNVDEKELKRICGFFRVSMSSLLKSNPNTSRSVVSACSAISGLYSPDLNNIVRYHHLSRQFFKYYGMTEDELRSVFEKKTLNKDYMKAISDWYNGYIAWDESKTKIINLWSVLHWLKDGTLTGYWSQELALRNLHYLLFNPRIKTIVDDLLANKSVELQYKNRLSLEEILLLKKMSKTCQKIEKGEEGRKLQISSEEQDLFIKVLYEFGYLSEIERNGSCLILKIPNNEIRNTFELTLTSLEFLKRYYFWSEADVNHFRNAVVDICDEPLIKQKYQDLIDYFKPLIPTENGDRFKKEDSPKKILYPLLRAIAGSKVISEVTVPGMQTVCDLGFIKNNTGILMEIKVGEKTNSVDALLQVFLKKYYKILDIDFKEYPVLNRVYTGHQIYYEETKDKKFVVKQYLSYVVNPDIKAVSEIVNPYREKLADVKIKLKGAKTKQERAKYRQVEKELEMNVKLDLLKILKIDTLETR